MSSAERIAKVQILSPILVTALFITVFLAYQFPLGFFSIKESDLINDGKAYEYLLRAAWGISLAVAVTAAIISISFSVFTILFNLPKRPARKYLTATTVVVVVASILQVVDWDLGGSAGAALIVAVERNLDLPINIIVELSAVISNAAMFYIAASASAIVWKAVTAGTADSTSAAYNFWTASLVISAILLVAGSLQIRLFYEWLAYSGEFSSHVVRALSVGGSVFYSVILITIFVPTSIALEIRTSVIMRSEIGAPTKEDSRKWRESHRLYRSPLRLTGRYALMAAPAIFGFLAELLQRQFP